jgi:hypothetical protein
LIGDLFPFSLFLSLSPLGADGIKGTTWQYTIPIMIFVACAGVAAGLTGTPPPLLLSTG